MVLTTFTLRQFKLADLDQVMYVNKICLPENYTRYFFIDLYRRFSEVFIVAEEAEDIVGYIMCRIEAGPPDWGLFGISKKGHVISVAVLPEHQRQGIGQALVHKALLGMETYRAKECYLEVRASNTPAVNLYKKLGFRILRTSRRYYADGEDAYVMNKKL